MPVSRVRWFDRLLRPVRPRLELLMQRAVEQPWDSPTGEAVRIRAMVHLLAGLLVLIVVSVLISLVGRYGAVLFLPVVAWLLASLGALALAAPCPQWPTLFRTAIGRRRAAIGGVIVLLVLGMAGALTAIAQSLLG
jgi:hypothetical protein